MKSNLITLFIAFIVGYIGASANQFFNPQSHTLQTSSEPDIPSSGNPFQLVTTADNFSTELNELKQKVSILEQQLETLEKNQSEVSPDKEAPNKSRQVTRSRPVKPDRENLLLAGVNPDIADDVLRRMSQQEYRRLELQNLIQRGGDDARQYRAELRELNRNRISLRSELGDETYDQYLYSSGQNNRVKVSSVMTDSPAELSGFQNDDVILYYDEQKILSWNDIRSATIQGEIGSYTNVEILRDGARMTLMVPRGTLGVQLDAMQLNPAEE